MAEAQLHGQVALVTGATRGIGRAIALELARAGATVIGTATTDDGAAKIAEGLAAAGHAGTGIRLDVADGAAVDAALADIEARFGAIAILVNNAGITRDNLLLRMKDDEWDAIMATNLKPAFRLAKGVLRGMMKARHGRIIQIGSVVGTSGNPGQANYAAAKAALIGFTKSLAQEVGSRNITINCIAPGFIDTDMTKALPEAQRTRLLEKIPLGRLGSPEDIAHAVVFLSPRIHHRSTLHVKAACTWRRERGQVRLPAQTPLRVIEPGPFARAFAPSGKIAQFQTRHPRYGREKHGKRRTASEEDRGRAAGRERGRDQERVVVCRGSGRRLAGHRRARDGARGGVRDRDPGRRSRKDHHGPAGDRLHRLARKEVTVGAMRADAMGDVPQPAARLAWQFPNVLVRTDADPASAVPYRGRLACAGRPIHRALP
jgi:3-oxoacyl-[acyl-carrier protein] reductase